MKKLFLFFCFCFFPLVAEKQYAYHWNDNYGSNFVDVVEVTIYIFNDHRYLCFNSTCFVHDPDCHCHQK